MVETFREHMQPAFVERLDAWTLQEQAGMDLPPIMIYGEDVTHILTEEGIANLLLCRSDAEREQAIRGVAGYTAVGLARDQPHGREPARPRRDPRPADLGIDPREPRATCWPRAACATWCAPRAACTSRPSASATGDQETDMSDIPRARTLDYRFPAHARPAPSRPCWSAWSARATSKCCSSRPRQRLRRAHRDLGARLRPIWEAVVRDFHRAIRWPACACR
jgi:hypothetical protein